MDFQSQQAQARQVYQRMSTNPLVAFVFFLLTILLVIPLILLAVCGVIVIAIFLPIRRMFHELFGSRRGASRTMPSDETPSGPVIDVEVTERK